MAARSLRTTLSARQSGGATSSGSSVECLTCPADRVRERFGPGTVAVADVGWAGLSSTGSSLSQTLVAPAQPFGDLLQRLDLHTARLVRHEIPVSDSPDREISTQLRGTAVGPISRGLGELHPVITRVEVTRRVNAPARCCLQFGTTSTEVGLCRLPSKPTPRATASVADVAASPGTHVACGTGSRFRCSLLRSSWISRCSWCCAVSAL